MKQDQVNNSQPIGFLKSLTLFILFLTTFLFAFESRIELPVWLQVTGRLHPLLLHVPIGIIVLAVLLLLLRAQFKSKQFVLLLTYLLLFITLSAAFTALFGLLLAIGGDYGANNLEQHKVSGLILAWLSYIVLWFYQSSSEIVTLKHAGIVLLLGVVVFVGHTGAGITHGENFIWEPLQKSQPELDPQSVSLYQLAVMPVLDKKCFSCHNEKKSKGKLIMTVAAKFKQGGESGAAFIPGNPDSSRMIQFIHLPPKHDDHMPPYGKPQLTQPEIQLLKAWIKSGADFDKKISEYKPNDTLVLLASQNTSFNVAPAYTFKAASADVIEKLNTPFRTVFPLHMNSPALKAEFFVKEYFEIKALEELRQIEDQLVSLSLSKMPVTDTDLKLLSGFSNLEILNLNSTTIDGSGLEKLASCKNLKSISLSGTKVTSETLKSILTLPQLKTVYIWNTAIDTSGKAELEKTYPHITFVHNLFTDESTLALSKPILVNEGILKATDKIELKHTMPEVTIRYTLDGTQPDSISGLLYEEPITIVETVKLKAIACKPGWFCSPLFEASIYQEGYKPLQAELLAPADKQYRGEGATSLTDGRKGFVDIFKEPAWLGFRDNNFEAGFDFGAKPPGLTKVVLSYGDNLGAYIFPPTEIQVWGGNSKDNLKLLMTQKFSEPKGYRTPHMSFVTINWETSNYTYYKIIAKPISKLPLWHGGKGQKGWFFVDEVFFY
ncbi:MAG: chitobiase/beta-hexosaminidase C-terminal domain-containing protein [Cyclobacteriaceae bacterium]|nr:chitobiase/beta-hexosaminidase C-terminal domain-containing protein [Cyclobacteriaceae bacterium]